MTKILVIEDERTICEDVCELLELEGFEAIGVEDGISGIRLAIQECPDLIICDIMMPECNGYQVLDAVRSQTPTAITPFIFLTAKVDRQSMRDGMELGADDYLTKPFTARDLLGAVRSRLEKQARQQAVSNQALDEKRREIIGVLSSELRMPFISLITMQELISRQIGQLSANELNQMLTTLRLGSQHLRYVIEQLVFAAQVETGILDQAKIQERGQIVYLFQLVETAVYLARGFTPRSREVFVHFEGIDRSIRILCDPDALRYSVAEIITYLVNLFPSDTTLTIVQEQRDEFAWIRVIFRNDTGLPSPIEQLSPLQHGYPQKTLQSLSMGLPVAKAIIGMHDGTLELHVTGEVQADLLLQLPIHHKVESCE